MVSNDRRSIRTKDMADRQDIDALLIGALYGELDDAERARLETHLASHPQDRSALDGLRSTRELLREADLPVSMAVAEPSPAITAMLLQEAARRAPASAARGGGFLGFLAGLLRP
ncbi:MAG: zf-HC2 domain-containing protein, partial [Deltaproteobacteria bacterium]|nr:zf-HC2 domain-containing protein [Kofleriaceae bacterium]